MRFVLTVGILFLMGFVKPNSSDNISLAIETPKLRINDTVTKIVVNKTERKLYAYFGDTVKWYRCAFGADPIGHKQRKGDNKTPEGDYFIEYKNPNSRGYKALAISYPNEQDKANAKKMGVDPGGDIMVHGLWWKDQDPITQWMYDWTWGCIALNNTQILELYTWTFEGTPITIEP
jgi:murein L,D-transpeptidase YafK